MNRVLMLLDQNAQAVAPYYDHAGSDETTLAGTAWTPALPAGCAAARVTNLSPSVTYRVRTDGQAATADRLSVPLPPMSWDYFPVLGGLSVIGTGQVHVAAARSA